MGGGSILMAVCAALAPIPTAMVLHGVTQLASNASRLWLLRRHVRWGVLGWGLLGALPVLGLFTWLGFVADKATLYLFLGGVPLVVTVLPRMAWLDVRSRPVALACGALNMASQLVAGVAGPLLDVFFMHSPLDRHGVVATKAAIGTLGHALKLVYFLALVAPEQPVDAPLWLYPVAVLCATLGSTLGKRLLARVSERRFRGASGVAILALSGLLVLKGLAEL